MYRKYRFIIAFIVVLSFMQNYTISVENTPNVPAQTEVDLEDLVILDEVSIETGFFSTCLEVRYSWNGGIRYVDGIQVEGALVNAALLLLSLDNMSWIRVATQIFNENEYLSNMSKLFSICNSFVHPFPFDVDKGETLYATIEYQFGWTWMMAPNMIRLHPIAIDVPKGITRLWYFTIDWTLPCIFGSIFLFLSVVFLVSRHHRKMLERRINKSED